jgi:hypothetical protein
MLISVCKPKNFILWHTVCLYNLLEQTIKLSTTNNDCKLSSYPGTASKYLRPKKKKIQSLSPEFTSKFLLGDIIESNSTNHSTKLRGNFSARRQDLVMY